MKRMLKLWLSTFTSREFDRMRRRLGILHDALMVGAAFIAAKFLTSGLDGLSVASGFYEQFFAFVSVSGLMCFLFELNSGTWRYASIPDLTAIVKSASVSVIVIALFSIGARYETLQYPVVLILLWFFMITLLAGPRIIYRMALEGGIKEILTGEARPADNDKSILIYKVNDVSEAYIRAVRVRTNSKVYIAGLLDETALKGSRSIQNLKVLGTLFDLGAIVDRLAKVKRIKITELCIADQRMDKAKLAQIVEMAADVGLKVSMIPDVVRTSGPNMLPDIDPKPLVLSDLIGRTEIKIDPLEISKFIKGKIVLITGAGGSIGSEIARQIVSYKPKKLIITDHCEHFLYTLDTELKDEFPGIDLITQIADVRNAQRINAIFAAHKPNIVFHAAALKHVPMVEQNICEAIKTNILGTRNCALAAVHNNVTVFVMISTDKAVNPTSVMGATKRAAEAYCQSLDLNNETTKFKTVRFGNVLDSHGSVVPRFNAQIAKGGPVTVTHPNIVRYFMTISESVALVLYTSAVGIKMADERGKIVVLNMGEPVRILDLAERMIRLAGLRPNSDIKIEFIGLRQGEKLYEELFAENEDESNAAHTSYFIASPEIYDFDVINRTLNAMQDSATNEDTIVALAHLSALVPEFDTKARHKKSAKVIRATAQVQ